MDALLITALLFTPLAGAFIAFMLAIGFGQGMRGGPTLKEALIPFFAMLAFAGIGALFGYWLDLSASAIKTKDIGAVLVSSAYILHGIGIYIGHLSRDHKLLKVPAPQSSEKQASLIPASSGS